MNSINRQTLIFIPDISGFTRFVNRTEIEHSRHIITELLELIINSDTSKMIVSEVEGDAVLFYKKGFLDLNELINQCKTTFYNFHNHLKKYETERICRCGACESASGLSLKFIIHTGEVDLINIKNHTKLHGTDVILAHRLLKNSIKEKEYILLSGNIMQKEEKEIAASFPWVEFHTGDENYEELGNISYDYIPLHGLNTENLEKSGIKFPELSSQKITMESTINAPVDVVYEYYTDLNKRVEWNEDISEIILKEGKLVKSGSIHACLVGSNTLNIESIGRIEDNDSITYGERMNKFKGLRDIINIFTFEKRGNETVLKIELDYKVKSLFGQIMKPIIHKMLKKQTRLTLNKLKKVSEDKMD